jgi:predicted DNA-binding protein (MmcQ/YjbR family)
MSALRRAIRRTSVEDRDGPNPQTFAAECAEKLSGAGLEHPFGPDWEVFKIRSKVFMPMTEVRGRPVVILEADPGDAYAPREHHGRVAPGYHLNTKHWITSEGGADVSVRELVTDSYPLLVAHLPRAERPVDPHTYGTGPGAVR